MKTLIEFHPPENEIEFLEEKLLQHNCRKIDNYSYENVIIKSFENSNSIIAGIHCQIGGGWLYIASLWVAEKLRQQGMGKDLLAKTEEIAIQKNCIGIYLYTYSFQNPMFYQKLGYHVFGELENFCGNNSKLFMKKILV